MKLIDLFTYNTLGGQRKLKMYIKFTLGILVAIVLIFGYSQWIQVQTTAALQASAVPILAVKTATSTVAPTETQPANTPVVESCVSDPEQWQLQDVRPDDNLKAISPACVYDGLGRTVAWALMVNMGYLPDDANQKLGFSQSPIANLGKLNIMTNKKGPLEIDISTRPIDKLFTQWVFDANAQPAIVFALRGCFRTQTITGNQVNNWGSGYPVICEIGRDYVDAYSLMGHTGDYFTTGQTGSVRMFSLFGYDGNRWIWLGEKQNQRFETKPLTVRGDIESYSSHYGAPIWDSQWLFRIYGTQPESLPANWFSYTNTTYRDNILQKLNTISTGGAP